MYESMILLKKRILLNKHKFIVPGKHVFQAKNTGIKVFMTEIRWFSSFSSKIIYIN